MNRWVLLEHTISNSRINEVHFDLLIEYGSDCLTWKIFEIPKLNGSFIKIFKQPNHRSVWLSRNQKILSRGRGYVRQIDSGNYSLIKNSLVEDQFSIALDGQLMCGTFKKEADLCKLYKTI